MKLHALILIGALAGCGSDPAPVVETATTEQRADLRSGDVHRYDFAWKVKSEGSNGMLGEVPLEGEVEMRGELAVRVYQETPGGVLLGVRFSRLDTHRLAVFGQNVLPTPEQLVVSEAMVQLSHGERPREVYFAPDAPSVFRKLMSGVLAHAEIHVPGPGAASWSGVGPTGNGLAKLAYARRADDAQKLDRSVEDYVRVDALPSAPADAPWTIQSKGTIELGSEGLVEAIEVHEALLLTGREDPLSFGSETEFSLRRAGIDHEEPLPAPDLDGWFELDLFDAPDNAESERELARQFAEGLTMTDLIIEVQSTGRGLRAEDGFLVRARGLLRGWPELAGELAPMFEDATNLREREFVVDLLVSADTQEAQEVLIDVLGQSAETSERPQLLQHLVLLRTPAVSMARFVERMHQHAVEEDDDELRRASLYPMGSIAAALTVREPALAERLLATIRAELDRSPTPRHAQAALAGLGNAGREEDTDRILDWRFDDDRGVRAQVASSLRASSDSRSDDVLFQMLADEERFVAASSLSVLDYYRPDEESLHRLASAVISGAVNPELTGPLISVLAARGLDDDWSREALVVLHDRTPDPSDRLRVKRILDLNT